MNQYKYNYEDAFDAYRYNETVEYTEDDYTYTYTYTYTPIRSITTHINSSLDNKVLLEEDDEQDKPNINQYIRRSR